MEIGRKHHLLIDCSYIKTDAWTKSSLGIYAVRMLQGFRGNDVFDVTAIVWKGYESFIDDSAGYKVPKIIIDGHHYVTPWPAVDRILGLISFKRELRDRKIDIVLSPFHFECRLLFPKKYHQHAVVHDLFIFDNVKKKLGRYHYMAWRLYIKLLHKRIAHFISISEETRKALKRTEGRHSDVVYNSIPFDFSKEEELVESVKGRHYIIDVNRLQRYKNAETLIRAFSLIKDKIPHILYLKGANSVPRDYEYLMGVITELQINDRVLIDCSYRSEGEMRYLYCHADLFVTPSLREGFGWTPIEAAILKTPVLVSQIDVLKEVTCGKLPMFDPYSPEDLAEKMLSILKNPPSRESREELSRFYQEKYSLKRQIDQLTEVFLQKLKAKQR